MEHDAAPGRIVTPRTPSASPRGRSDPYELSFVTDPRAFLEECGALLARAPVLTTVVAANATAAADAIESGVHPPAWAWYLIVRDRSDGEIVGVGMRTAAHDPSLGYLLPMREGAARAVARTVHERGDRVTSVNGAIEATRAYGDELARLIGAEPTIRMRTRLFEATAITRPRPVSGRLRAARADEAGICQDWHDAFVRDADEQAGRPPGPVRTMTDDEVARRIRAGRLWFWVDGDDLPVHLTGTSLPSFGSTRLGPVYTPRAERGHGYASAAVSELAQRILDEGSRPCLFTDQANPVSNAIYLRLGFRPVVDTVDLVLTPPSTSGPRGRAEEDGVA